MKYCCAACGGEFLSQNAIDAYKKGFKRGFLCPLCGENIIDDKVSWGLDFALFIVPVLIGVPGFFKPKGMPADEFEPLWFLIIPCFVIALITIPIIIYRQIMRSNKTINTFLVNEIEKQMD